jgi:hypothetical protein
VERGFARAIEAERDRENREFGERAGEWKEE